MAVFNIKAGNTLPVLEVALKNPDGSPHDLTGSTARKLHIKLSDGSKLIRDMVIFGAATAGVLRYQWVATDWNAPSGGDPAPVGGLVAGPTLPLRPNDIEHRIEYEVIGGANVLTIPNDSYDTLRILANLAL